MIQYLNRQLGSSSFSYMNRIGVSERLTKNKAKKKRQCSIGASDISMIAALNYA